MEAFKVYSRGRQDCTPFPTLFRTAMDKQWDDLLQKNGGVSDGVCMKV